MVRVARLLLIVSMLDLISLRPLLGFRRSVLRMRLLRNGLWRVLAFFLPCSDLIK